MGLWWGERPMRKGLNWVTANKIGEVFNRPEIRRICEECWTHTPMGCCKNCGPCVGYYREFEVDKLFSALRLRRFTRKYGFWTKNGCSLPRELRSTTCMMFTCHRIPVSVQKEVSKLVVEDQKDAASNT